MIEKKDASGGVEIGSELILKYIKGISTDAENALVDQWLNADSGNEKVLLQTANIYYVRNAQVRMESRDTDAAYHKIQKSIRRKHQRHFTQRLLAAAACLLLLISVGFNSYFYMQKESDTSSGVQYVTMQTNAGMRTQVILPDGTEVYLNSATKLTYPIPFAEKERRVTLEGEAYFKVQPESQRSFIVALTDKPVEVDVLGTEFNMQAYADDSLLKTTLVSGSVRLAYERTPGDRRYALLKPSQRAVYDVAASSVCVESVNTIYDTAWMQGRLMFKDTPIPEVLNRLSRFYNVRFQVDKALIHNHTFTGTFENRQLSQVLDYLGVASNIKYKIVTPVEDDSKSLKRTHVILTPK